MPDMPATAVNKFKKLIFSRYGLCILGLWLADGAVKILIQRLILPSVMNQGISFSFLNSFSGPPIVCLNLLIIVLLFYIMAFQKLRSTVKLGLALMIAGTLGNLTERLTNGYVLDWIKLPLSAALFEGGLWINISDIYLTAGAALIILYFIRNNE